MTHHHYNPLLVTVLPKERRARHPYQLAAMGMLFSLGLWQLLIAPLPTSAVNVLDVKAYFLLNVFSVAGGAAGIFAAWVPERIVCIRLFRWDYDFDATYWRLGAEFGSHFVLFTVWLSYGVAVWQWFGLVKGYSVGLAAAIWLGGAALGRCTQIVWTVVAAGTFKRPASAIVSFNALDHDGE